MSAVAAPMIGKMLVGTLASKVVGKVTGNDKLGLIAGLAAGAMTPGVVEGPALAEGVAGPREAQSLMGAGLDKGKDILTGTAGWVKDNPYGSHHWSTGSRWCGWFVSS
jgi:hypothetical protein